MKRLIAISFLILLLANVSNAALLFYDDCEDAPNYSRDWNSSGDTPTVHTSGTDGVPCRLGAGTNCYRFRKSAGAERSELALRGYDSPIAINNFIFGQEYWVGWSVYVPSDFTFLSFFTNGQFHDSNKPGDCDTCNTHAAIGLDIQPSGANWVYRVQVRNEADECSDCSYSPSHTDYSSPITVGGWNDVVVHVKFHWSSANFTQIWINGELVSDYSDGNAFNDPAGPFMKIGVYLGDADDPYVRTVYFDEIKVGDENSSYDEVAPGGAANTAPVVSIDSPMSQTISVNDYLNHAMTCSDAEDTTCTSFSWSFDDSGISSSTVEDPGSLQYTQAGSFVIRATGCDSEGLCAYDESTITVGAGGITGLVSEHLFDTASPGADHESNMDYTLQGDAALEGTGTVPYTPDSGDDKALILDGTGDYCSVSAYHSSMPWQSGKNIGTAIFYYQTPAADPGNNMYLGGRYDTSDNRTNGHFLYTPGMRPRVNIGVSSGTSFEGKYQSENLSTSNWYCTAYRIDATSKLWAIDTYDVDGDSWMTPASGTITGTMHLPTPAAGADFILGGRSDLDATSYFSGKIGWDQWYDTWLSDAEIIEACEGAPDPPPAATNIIDSMCFCDPDSYVCYSTGKVFHTGEEVCVKTVFGLQQAYNFTGPYTSMYWPFTLDSGSLSMRYKAGIGTNEFISCDVVGTDDYEAGDITLSAVSDFVKGAATIVNEAGVELASYDAPATDFDSNAYQVIGTPHMWFAPTD